MFMGYLVVSTIDVATYMGKFRCIRVLHDSVNKRQVCNCGYQVGFGCL